MRVVERDHLSRYGPLDLEPGCSPRLPHEAGAHTTTFVISAVSIIPYANPVTTKKQLNYAMKQEKTR